MGAPPSFRAHGRVVEQSRAKRKTLRVLHAALSTVLRLEARVKSLEQLNAPLLRCGQEEVGSGGEPEAAGPGHLLDRESGEQQGLARRLPRS